MGKALPRMDRRRGRDQNSGMPEAGRETWRGCTCSSRSQSRGGFFEKHFSVHVLVVTDCFPIPNLFPCKYLVRREGNAWLYKPDLSTLREKLRLPVGSCELAVPLKAKARLYSCADAGRHTRRSCTRRTRTSAGRSPRHRASAGGVAPRPGHPRRRVNQRRAPRRAGVRRLEGEDDTAHSQSEGRQDAYNEWNYSKFRLWQLTDYDKVVFVDADLLVLLSVDFLFAAPEISATGNNASLFNSGVMVIEPSNCTFGLLMEHVHEITSYNGGDQGYLNEIFAWWHRIPRRMNFLKHFWEGDSEAAKAQKTRLFAAEPPVLYVLHYLGMKPWLCFRDYDCNWNADIYRQFASDAAHARWWRVHDGMPENLRKFCFLSTRQKAAVEWDRRQAEQANFSDGHWRGAFVIRGAEFAWRSSAPGRACCCIGARRIGPARARCRCRAGAGAGAGESEFEV
uniref:Uncharacterized protein n=1 Tax=Ananas comosus var. bracteatus TaxID=296719 RepID=A0A6V7Q7P0_ANACO|nr:unnamed protein product [Ananas comosus var. bracteatus]